MVGFIISGLVVAAIIISSFLLFKSKEASRTRKADEATKKRNIF